MANGCITWTVTQPGAYTVTEEDRAGWTHQGASSADFTVVSAAVPYSHTFVNFQDVPITACKQDTEGRAVKDWLMTLAGPEPQAGQTLANGCITWTVTQPGAYTVTEADRALDASRCGERRLHGGLGRRSLQPHLRQLPDVAITACKRDTEGAAVKDWLMTLTGPEPQAGQTLANGCITWTVTQPGAYTVTEADRAGWTPQGASSADFTVVSVAVLTATPSSTGCPPSGCPCSCVSRCHGRR